MTKIRRPLLLHQYAFSSKVVEDAIEISDMASWLGDEHCAIRVGYGGQADGWLLLLGIFTSIIVVSRPSALLTLRLVIQINYIESFCSRRQNHSHPRQRSVLL